MALFANRTGIYFYFDNIDKHAYEDENVIVVMTPAMNGVTVLVYNKTDKILFVDKGTSFFSINGRNENMFRSMVNTSGTMRSTFVNLGNMAYAAGLRGPLGMAMSGITIGGSSFSSVSVIEKRVIPVPPHGTEPVYITGEIGIGAAKNVTSPKGIFQSHHRYMGKKMGKGMVREFTEDNSVLKYKATVRYGFTEDCSSPKEVSLDNHLKALVVDSPKGERHYETANLPYCQRFREDAENYSLWNSFVEGERINDMQFLVGFTGGLALFLGVFFIVISAVN